MKQFLVPGLLVGGTLLAVLLFAAGGDGDGSNVQEFVAPNGVRYRVRKMGTDPVSGEPAWAAEVFTGATTSGFEFLPVPLLPFHEAKQAALQAATEMENNA